MNNTLKSLNLTLKQALSQAKKATKGGNSSVAIEIYSAILTDYPNSAVAKKGLQKLQNNSSKTSIKKRLDPPQNDINDLINLYHSGNMLDTETCAKNILQHYPQSLDTLIMLGVAYQGQGKLQEALRSYEKAIELKPDFAEAYSNRANILKKLGKFEDALANYEKAIELKPDFADAYFNYGNILKDVGKLEDSIKIHDKAINLKPGFAEAYNNQGNTFKDLHKPHDAIKNYKKAIELKPNYIEAYNNLANILYSLESYNEAVINYKKAINLDPHNITLWHSFASILQNIKFSSYNEELLRDIQQILKLCVVRPKDISTTIISAFPHHPIVSNIIKQYKTNSSDQNINNTAKQLSEVPILLELMKLSPIANPDIEIMLKKMREAMLYKVLNESEDIQGLSFYIALALHCFINEYIFTQTKNEKQNIILLENKIKTSLEENNTIPSSWVLVLGAYKPLYSFSWSKQLLELEYLKDIQAVLTEQIINVLYEKDLRYEIQNITTIDNKISQSVREQYEENPYPRWINTSLHDKPRDTKQVLQAIKLNLDFHKCHFLHKPNILVAGCGTGQHALSVASRFLNSNVLAIDLSLSSLAYAIRKTKELKIDNIKYMQGDILKLCDIEKKFDIIESSGVLHHMENPLDGWKVLVDKLNTNGVMKIGLYSKIARENITAARNQIAQKEYTSTADSIRQYREEIFNMDSDSIIHKIVNSVDFYSLSECRDLLFHAQEHCFTLLQIEEALAKLGLKFLGFELKQSSVTSEFIEQNPLKGDITSLSLWHKFELENPDIFAGMYQFWVQKI